ncbi:MAG: HYR domain-containing protein, partial [Armatimonadota bacterium]
GFPVVTDTLAGVESMDAVRSDNSAHLKDSSFQAPYSVGVTTITWSARDRAGNVGTCLQSVTITDTQVPTINCPTDITVYAPPKSNSAIVTYAATAFDDCGMPTIVYSHPSGSSFPTGTTQVTATADDGHGNTASCSFDVTVIAQYQVKVSVELESVVNTPLNRCITFIFGGTGGTETPYTVTQTGTFVNKLCTFHLTIPSGKVYTRVAAKDNQNSLQRRLALQVNGDHYSAAFTGTSKLICGDATKDNIIDIADFGVLAGQYGQYISPVPCGYAGSTADFNGNGHVGTEDYTFIQIHFLTGGASTPGNAALASISVRDLAARRVANPMRADLNRDGKVDATDIKLFAQKYLGARPR